MTNDVPDTKWAEISLSLLKDPDNFSKWESLIKASEAINGGICKSSSAVDKKLFRSAFDQFLLKFPLLHQYWINYATWEFKLGHTDLAEKVYSRALQFSPYSIEIWISYLKFRITVDPDYDSTRALFEKARVKIGYHYFGHEFYDLYLEVLQSFDKRNEWVWLLRRVIELPLYHYGKYFKEFFKLIENIPNDPEIALLLIPQSQLLKFNLENTHETSAKLKKTFTDVYISTQYEVFEMWRYERAIKRHYFHVTYVSTTELESWELYLNYMELKADPHRTALTYERCLIATALYEKFWLKYAYYQLSLDQVETAKELLRKGIYFTPMSNVALKLKLVEFEICQGNYLRARDIILLNMRMAPELLPLYVALLNVELLLKPDEAHLLELVLNKVNGDGFDVLFEELMSYDVKYQTMEAFFAKYKDTKTSIRFWKSYLLFQIRNQAVHGIKNTTILELMRQALVKVEGKTDRNMLIKLWRDYLLENSGLDEYYKSELDVFIQE
ncbi:hypothetical protein BABINDRAFT_158880 [Babjeviella inositovora NRRL Y-12698]|uniref:Suppressor of forked domain-containing protein n=1 Tax=Babjeviella inositovora NRRL Y-12698 TaxID=984486 RepID=A0A1E3QX32_9ASCO|nr:uncharacterized protein BABINDRAFT_158880 [Babjeviella inositovora NRRL Y-12698]ODQ82245.1 hypothetical protein BABINDRAFT_158880 [Babjeviella inositovora NRRL Y-12698]